MPRTRAGARRSLRRNRRAYNKLNRRRSGKQTALTSAGVRVKAVVLIRRSQTGFRIPGDSIHSPTSTRVPGQQLERPCFSGRARRGSRTPDHLVGTPGLGSRSSRWLLLGDQWLRWVRLPRHLPGTTSANGSVQRAGRRLPRCRVSRAPSLIARPRSVGGVENAAAWSKRRPRDALARGGKRMLQ